MFRAVDYSVLIKVFMLDLRIPNSRYDNPHIE